MEYSGDIAWTEQNSDRWTVNLTMISAGDRINPPDPQWSAAVATEDLSLSWPQYLLDWYFQGINATWSAFDKTYRYPCNITLPDFVFAVGNGTFRVPGSYLPYQRDLSGNCISIITGTNSTSADYTFGSWWVQLGFLVLDFENSRVGFANKSTPLPSYGVSSLEVVPFA
uniref:Podosporapepsin n=1 Tax=Talaromyces marneffei PM1 TaxID=1077442 RepID=A0A093VGA3_TALMA